MPKKRKSSNISGLKPFSSEYKPTPEMIEKRTNTRKLVGRFREVAINMLDSSERSVRVDKIKYFVDKFDNLLTPKDPIEKVHHVIYLSPTYEYIVQRMINLAANGDHHARRQLIELVQGYRETEAEKDEAIREFFERITVSSPQLEAEAIEYEQLKRTPD